MHIPHIYIYTAAAIQINSIGNQTHTHSTSQHPSVSIYPSNNSQENKDLICGSLLITTTWPTLLAYCLLLPGNTKGPALIQIRTRTLVLVVVLALVLVLVLVLEGQQCS